MAVLRFARAGACEKKRMGRVRLGRHELKKRFGFGVCEKEAAQLGDPRCLISCRAHEPVDEPAPRQTVPSGAGWWGEGKRARQAENKRQLLWDQLGNMIGDAAIETQGIIQDRSAGHRGWSESRGHEMRRPAPDANRLFAIARPKRRNLPATKPRCRCPRNPRGSRSNRLLAV